MLDRVARLPRPPFEAGTMQSRIVREPLMHGKGTAESAAASLRAASAEQAALHPDQTASGRPHLLYVSGEDHHFRIPFMLALRERGFRVTAAGTGDSRPFECAGIDFHRFEFDRFVNPLADLAAIKALARLLADIRPDIVQTCDTKPNYLVPLAGRRLRDLPIVRLINGRGWVFSSRSPRARALRPIYRALYRLADRSTAANVFEIQDDLEFFGGRRRSSRDVVIPGWVDIDAFDCALACGPSPEQLRREFDLVGAEVVVTVTRMTRQKGIPALLEAAAIVHAVRPGVRFLLVGPRESEGPLAVTQGELDRHAPYVVAVGPRSDVAAVLRSADIFAFPTEYGEGVPRALLEAALAERPIVTTSLAGCRDVVRDGWSGFLVPPRAPRVLAERILTMLQERELARTMASRAATRVRQKFGLASIVARYAALYTEISGYSRRGELPATGRYRLGPSAVGES